MRSNETVSKFAYTLPEFTDWEDCDHAVVKGTWRRYETGVFKTLNSGNVWNPCFSAKEQRNVLKNYFTLPAGRLSWQEDEISDAKKAKIYND